MRITAIILLVAAPFALGAERPAEPFAPLAFLAGSCWSGTFPDGKSVDEHCFTWIYDGAFLRDVHIVRAPGKPDYLGETIYHWDGEAEEIGYRYFNSLGGTSDGTVTVDGNALLFPDETYKKDGVVRVFRTTMRKSGEGYSAVTEEKTDDGWKESTRIEFRRLRSAK